MITVGEYRKTVPRNSKESEAYKVIVDYTSTKKEVILVYGVAVMSAYKIEDGNEYCYNNMKAKDVYERLYKGIKDCSAKNVSAVPFELGTAALHTISKANAKYKIMKYNSELAGAEVNIVKMPAKSKREEDGRPEYEIYIYLGYTEEQEQKFSIPYIQLTTEYEFEENESQEDRIQVRSLEEVSLRKDISWLLNKKYYIINDDSVCENILNIMENWNGPIAYDTETTGLRINMFSKINSKEKAFLDEYNKDKPREEQIRADSLVGVILCVEENVSYYFPVANRKFANVYSDPNSEIRKRLIDKFKSAYTIGEFRELNTDMARYWRGTPANEITSDCIFMERIRYILTKKHIATHNGTFDWKVAYCYDIDTNICDDTIILHQLMYKFRSTTKNSGESSKLKDLAKRELGIDQLDLSDFFVGYTEDESGTVSTKGVKRVKKNTKKKKLDIDFSYMDYAGAKAYGPADGDVTLCLLHKYKKDLMENHKEMEYLYSVELIVAAAIGYMEFYGHRLDVTKIDRVRDNYYRQALLLEHKIRKEAKLDTPEEIQAFERLAEILDSIESYDKRIDELKETGEEKETLDKLVAERQEQFALREEQEKLCRLTIDESENQFNLASVGQVASLFYDRMNIEPVDGVRTVAKKPLKALLKLKDENGNAKYPIVKMYSEWKSIDTMLTKFFDNLQYFMFPGGFIFSRYGQISTATGRMSCSKP